VERLTELPDRPDYCPTPENLAEETGEELEIVAPAVIAVSDEIKEQIVNNGTIRSWDGDEFETGKYQETITSITITGRDVAIGTIIFVVVGIIIAAIFALYIYK